MGVINPDVKKEKTDDPFDILMELKEKMESLCEVLKIRWIPGKEGEKGSFIDLHGRPAKLH